MTTVYARSAICTRPAFYSQSEVCILHPVSGLSSRAGGRGFSPATKRVAPGYFYWKIEEK